MYLCNKETTKLFLPEVYEDKWDRGKGLVYHFQLSGYCRSWRSCDIHSVLFRTCDQSRVSLPEVSQNVSSDPQIRPQASEISLDISKVHALN